MERLKHSLNERAKRLAEMVLGGGANDILSYKMMVTEMNVLNWVKDEIAKLEMGDDDDDGRTEEM